MKKVLPIVTLAAIFWRPAAAGPIHLTSYDLPVLVLRSWAIVLAEREATAGGNTVFRVTKVFKGALVPGLRITVDLGIYGLHGDGWGARFTEIDPQNLLFLGGLSLLDQDTKPAETYDLLPAGIKVIVEGRVYGFYQGMFGLYSLFGETLETPYPSFTKPTVTVEEYGQSLRQAIARVEELSACLQVKDRPERREKLLALLSTRPPSAFYQDYVELRADGLEIRVLKHLYHDGKIDDLLEGLWRLQSFRLPFRPEQLIDTEDPSGLLSAAKDPTLPSHLRAAAVLALQSCWWHNEALLSIELPRLLGDPDAQVRLAAAVSLGSSYGLQHVKAGAFAGLKQALARHLREEADAFHRVIHLPIAETLKLLPQVYPHGSSEPLILEACFRDSQVLVQWVNGAGSGAYVTAASFQAVAEVPGTPRVYGSSHSRASNLATSEGSWKFPFDPLPPPGSYRYWVEGTFTIKGKKQPIVVKSPVSSIEVKGGERKSD